MDILKFNFTVYNYCGLWWPEQAASPKTKFYTILQIFTLTLLYSFMLMQFFDMVFGNYTIDKIINNSFMVLTMLSFCFKVTNFVFRRKNIIDLLNILREDICKHQNETEAKIQRKFNDIARSNTLVFESLVEVTATCFVIVPILTGGYKTQVLPFKAWFPYSLSNVMVYWAMYILQSISLIVAAGLNVVSDTLVSGLLVHACAQLDILRDRLVNLVNPRIAGDEFGQPSRSEAICADVESTIIKCVQHHVIIYKFAAKVQSTFSWVIFFQFFVSIVTLCSNVLQLSRKNAAGMEIATFMAYTVCISMQLLLYCWHGNEVKLKSSRLTDAVYLAEWTLLHPNTTKGLKMIMMRSNMPIDITCGSMFTLSLQTYAMVLKASYSAFNLLHTV